MYERGDIREWYMKGVTLGGGVCRSYSWEKKVWMLEVFVRSVTQSVLSLRTCTQV